MFLLSPHPTIFTLGDFALTTHGFFFALGAAVGALYLMRQAKQFGAKSSEVLEWVLWIFVIGLLAARVTYLFAYPSEWESVADLIAIWHGGLVSFGGLLAGYFTAKVVVRKLPREQRLAWYDAAGIALLLAWAIGRLGNYYAQESVGVVSLFWHLTYDRIPIQLFELFGCLIIALLLIRFKTHFKPGALAHVALMSYLVLRFIVDIWRDEGSLFGLHISQYVSLLGMLIIAIYYRKHYVQS